MSFLVPGALLGLTLLAIPIIVHLFKPRKMKPTPFSSLRWLRASHQKMSRRIQWHQWILFLMRAGIITFLVLALAQPFFRGSDSGVPTDRIVIVDVSRSMGYTTGTQMTPGKLARELALARLDKAIAGDRTALVAVDSRARVISPWVDDALSLKGKLAALQPGLLDTQLSAVLPALQSLVSAGDDVRPIELVFFTDNPEAGWQQSAIQDFVGYLKTTPRQVRLEIIDVGLPAPANAWIASASSYGYGEKQFVEIDVGSNAEIKGKHYVVIGGDFPEQRQEIELVPGRVARSEFQLPALELKGKIVKIHLEPGDGLASDDTFYLPLSDVGQRGVLVLESDNDRDTDGRLTSVFVKTALQSLKDKGKQSVEILEKQSGQALPDDVSQAQVIFLTGVSDLSEPLVEKLEQRVRAGAGLVLFLGGDLTKYNAKLFNAAQPELGLLPFKLKFGNASEEPSLWTEVRWSHPVLAALADPKLSDLAKVIYHQHAEMEGELAPADRVLARFQDGTPALVERPLAAGRVVFFNTSASTDLSGLAKTAAFTPLIDRLVAYLAGGVGKSSWLVGDDVQLLLKDWDRQAPIEVVTPAGQTRTANARVLRGDPWLHLENADETGIYVVKQADKELRFVVNVPRGDSLLAPMDPAALKSWWQPVDVQTLTPDEVRERWKTGEQSWPWLLLLVGVLLLVETIYGYWLCPRVNPTATASVIYQRGLFRPSEEASV